MWRLRKTLTYLLIRRVVFSERSLYVAVCLLSSVCNVCAPYSGRLKFSAMFLHHLVRWSSADIQVKFYGDHPRGTPPPGELNTRGVAEYSDIGPINRYISETVQASLY